MTTEITAPAPEVALPFRALRWLTVPPVLLERSPVPLKLGIRDDLAAMLAPGQEKALNNALAWHCGSPVYIEALLCDHPRRRFDAFGAVAGEVTDTDRLSAAARLNAWTARSARRAAEPRPPAPATRPAGPNTAKPVLALGAVRSRAAQ